MNDRIYLRESLDGPIKLGLGKFLNTIILPKAWLVVISFNTKFPGDALNNYTIGSDIELNPENHNFSCNKVGMRFRGKHEKWDEYQL